MLENVKQRLADEIVRSRKVEQEQEKKSALRHNKQMEEIRNRHVSLVQRQPAKVPPLIYYASMVIICC